MMKYAKLQFALGTAALAVMLGATMSAAASPGSISAETYAFGRQGDAKKVMRTITVDMNDRMRFIPGDIKIRQGETIRFVVRNQGKVLHEMVIGTMAALKSHHAMMQQHPGMEHEEAYATHVGAGRKGEIVWQFTEAGEFHYACLIPGHFEAGMVGKFTVTKG